MKGGIGMAKFMLSTIDNPFNPFEQFDQWYMFDLDKGYSSCSFLDRIARTSDQLSDEENDVDIERAIDEIIKYDFQNIYIKVKLLSEDSSFEENKIKV
jgi:hypothetical protein